MVESLTKKLRIGFHRFYSRIDPGKYSPINGYVSEKYNFIYIPVPKIASSTLKRWFLDIHDDQPLTGNDSKLAVPESYIVRVEDFKKYPIMAFVRNPWARVVSCYRSKIKQDPHFNSKSHTHGVHNGFLRLGGFHATMSFEEFVRRIAKILDYDADRHFKSQSRFLKSRKGKVLATHLGKIESFDDDFLKIMKDLGIKHIDIGHNNFSGEYNYKEYYDTSLRKMIAKRYREDIETFNYKF